MVVPDSPTATPYVRTYVYDLVGRLAELRDAGGRIAAFTYDAAGRLARKDLGNNTFTTFDYDPAGQLLHLVNHAPNGGVSSRFDYTYGPTGLRTSVTTLDGTWTFGYDPAGQLTRAVFASTNAGVPNQDLTYVYDSMGNRTRTIENGVTTDYVANNLNQYVTVGGATFTHDLDGNLIAVTGGTTDASYDFDSQNRLVRVTTSAGVWEYEYDAFGNRRAVIHNGQRTEFLLEPTGLVDVVGEYDAAGSLVNRYTHGLGLTSQISATGTARYYDFDALGSTVGLTGSGGSLVNRYAYRPFGETIASAEGVANPFQFIGQFGVMNAGNGLSDMRHRFYSHPTGRFVTPDPIRNLLPAANHYSYTDNNPVLFSDPLGLYFGQGGPGDGTLPLPDFGPRPSVVPEDVPLQPEQQDTTPKPLGIDDTLGQIRDNKDAVDRSAVPVPQVGGTPGAPSWIDNIRLVLGGDPNEKTGAAGYGTPRFVAPAAIIPYGIDFENEPTAKAAAQEVVVTDRLDPSLDLDTFELTEIGFGDISIPAGSRHVQTRVAVTIDGEAFEVWIEAGLDVATRTVFARFQSIDPATSLPPNLAGFLRPEDGTGRGRGRVGFVIRPRAGLPTGTVIRNVALITFDGAETVATNQIAPHDPAQGTDPAKEAFNTIDAGAPTSSVAALPAVSATASFTVSWFGTDDVNGSGVAAYTVYVSEDGGPFVPFVAGTLQTSAVFTGRNGHTYRFYSVATDHVGNREPAATVADAIVTVSVPPSPQPVLLGYPQFVVGADVGGSVVVRAYNPDASVRSEVSAFDGPVPGGVRVASADFTGDGIADIIVGTGPGVPTLVRILDGADGHELFHLAPFEAAFLGGVYVAAGDLTGDGVPELVITPDEGGGPRVRVFRGTDFGLLTDFFGIDDPNFRGGCRAAVGDLTGDGVGDLVISAGFGGGPRVSIYDGRALTQAGTFLHPVADFFLFEPALRNGAYVAAGDVDGDGLADVVGGGGPGGGPRVYVLSGGALLNGQMDVLANFFAGNPDDRGGVRVGVKNLDADGHADVVVGDGAQSGGRVRAYAGKDMTGGDATPTFAFDPFPGFGGGVFVG
jgi:RHS repeat-associated protein